jgi:hypothetical protein
MGALRLLDAAGISVRSVAVSQPSLDDVFMQLTTRLPSGAREEQPEPRALFRRRD